MTPRQLRRRRGITALGLALAAAVGVFVGLGTFTFQYGEGTSYLSDDPTSCINCHIMRPQYDSWISASHAHVATCNDCHMPEQFPHSILAKIDNGWNHSWAFTFDNFHEPIQIKPRNLRILENNCIRCHGDLVHPAIVTHDLRDWNDRVSCVHCHQGVGHGMPR